MSNGADEPIVVLETVDEIKQLDMFAEPVKPPLDDAIAEFKGDAQGVLDQVKDSVKETLEAIVQSGSADQMRGYVNEAMGKTKVAAGLAMQSCELTLEGIAQAAIGEIRKFIGEAKTADGLTESAPLINANLEDDTKPIP